MYILIKTDRVFSKSDKKDIRNGRHILGSEETWLTARPRRSISNIWSTYIGYWTNNRSYPSRHRVYLYRYDTQMILMAHRLPAEGIVKRSRAAVVEFLMCTHRVFILTYCARSSNLYWSCLSLEVDRAQVTIMSSKIFAWSVPMIRRWILYAVLE